eukprot:11694055-Karenia_brevis.AAC.1
MHRQAAHSLTTPQDGLVLTAQADSVTSPSVEKQTKQRGAECDTSLLPGCCATARRSGRTSRKHTRQYQKPVQGSHVFALWQQPDTAHPSDRTLLRGSSFVVG